MSAPVGSSPAGVLSEVGLDMVQMRLLGLSSQFQIALKLLNYGRQNPGYYKPPVGFQGIGGELTESPYWGSPLVAVSVALEAGLVPFQLPLLEGEVLAVCDLFLGRRMKGVYPEAIASPEWVTAKALVSSDSLRERLFPYKTLPQATRKANLHLKRLLTDLPGTPTTYDAFLTASAGRMSDDQVCGCLLYVVGAAKHLGQSRAEWVAYNAVVEPSLVKELSTCLKAVGAGATLAGAMLCETNVLAGRGVGTLDAVKEIERRADPALVEQGVVSLPEDRLRRAVHAIITEELTGRDLEFPDLDSFWDRRWVWCVNGAHNRAHDAAVGVDLAAKLPGIDRFYRRMFAEAVESEPISKWDGQVTAGLSQKLEHGKTRAIFACDTLSYFAFEHLLGPVASAWRNRRVVLDPGQYGTLGMCEKVVKLRHGRGYNVMLDYDDFNSQHSTRSMQIVFEELCSITGYPPSLAAKLISSFDNTWIRTPEGLRKVAGTLMSGHRGTTFINSVLNAAYIRASIGEESYRSSGSVHVGDDVYLCVSTLEEAAGTIMRCQAAGCRMNRSKQSVGPYCAEFLRINITEHSARGYLARAVASAVSGNWVNERKLGPREALAGMIGTARTLFNRSGGTDFSRILSGCVAAVTRLPKAEVRRLLAGTAALGEGPVWSVDGKIRRYEYFDSYDVAMERLVPRAAPEYATTAYLSRAAAPVEVRALELEEVSVKSAMLSSSYSKSLTGELDERLVRPVLVPSRERVPRGSVSARSLLRAPAPLGVLSRYPVLALLKHRLSRTTVRRLLYDLGELRVGEDVLRTAWGGRQKSVCIRGFLLPQPCGRSRRSTSPGAGRSLGQVGHVILFVFEVANR
nr:MAG: RNA dependent RNA polymerase [Ustilaginoidea virens RNA virus 9]